MAESNTQVGAVVREVESGPTFEVWSGHASTGKPGAMRLDWTRAGAVRIVIVGHGYAEYAPIIVKRWEHVLKFRGRMTVLFDYEKMETYDSRYRTDTQGWGSAHLKDLDAIYILTRSKLVQMGASVANLVLGGMVKVETSRPGFDAQAQQLGLPLNPKIPA